MSDSSTAFIGLGANLGNCRRNLQDAVDLLRSPEIRVCALSSCYRTPPLGPVAQPEFLNAVCRLATSLSPQQLMNRCLRIEERLGRQRRERWGPRTIDLDLLYFDQLVIDTPDLVIPHPRLHERRFVLVPLAELSPEWWDPLRRLQVSQLLAACPDESAVELDRP